MDRVRKDLQAAGVREEDAETRKRRKWMMHELRHYYFHLTEQNKLSLPGQKLQVFKAASEK